LRLLHIGLQRLRLLQHVANIAAHELLLIPVGESKRLKLKPALPAVLNRDE